MQGEFNPIPFGYLKVHWVVSLSLKRPLDRSQSGPQPAWLAMLRIEYLVGVASGPKILLIY